MGYNKNLNMKGTATLSIIILSIILISSFLLYFFAFKNNLKIEVINTSESYKFPYLGEQFDCPLPYYNLEENIIHQIEEQLNISNLTHKFSYRLEEIGKFGNYSIFEVGTKPLDSFELPNIIDVEWYISNSNVIIVKYGYMNIELIETHEEENVTYQDDKYRFIVINKGVTYHVFSNIIEDICKPKIGNPTTTYCPSNDCYERNDYIIKIEAQIVRFYAFFVNDWTLLSETAAKGKFYIKPCIRIEKVDDLSYDWVSWYTYRCQFNHNKEGEGTISAQVRAYGKYRETLCPGIATHWDASPYVNIDACGNVDRNPRSGSWWIQFGCC